MLVPLWCDMGCCSRTVVVIQAAAKIRKLQLELKNLSNFPAGPADVTMMTSSPPRAFAARPPSVGMKFATTALLVPPIQVSYMALGRVGTVGLIPLKKKSNRI